MIACIQVLGANGYVWDADVSKWLRLECGLVGAMVGGVSAFKQQNAVHGLPLELSPEEVTLALERGWGALEVPPRAGEAAAALAAVAASRNGEREGAGGSPPHHSYQDDLEGSDGDFDAHDAAAERQQAAEPAWRAALRDGSTFVVPGTRAEAAAANGCSAAEPGGAAAAAADAGAAPDGTGTTPWAFPCTQEERYRYWVFRDLHAKGYRVTGGSKFGADFLVYPGDPTLFHAQFCVRLAPYRQPLQPSLLAAATRGSHQARKHLLLASVVEEGQGGEEDAGGGACGATAADGAAGAGGGLGDAAELESSIGQGREGHLGADSRGVGSKGERFRIRYLTIGPVEGFG